MSLTSDDLLCFSVSELYEMKGWINEVLSGRYVLYFRDSGLIDLYYDDLDLIERELLNRKYL